MLGELDDGNGEMRYRSVNACIQLLATLDGRQLITVEDLAQEELHPVQQAMVDHHGSQCGFCTPGFLVSLTGFFFSSGDLSEKDALVSIDGNICRCTGYNGILEAVLDVADPAAPMQDEGEK